MSRPGGRLVLLVAGRGYRALLLTLLVAATLPTAWGWSASVVLSGSMAPALDIGDVVVTAPLDTDGRDDRVVRVGQVVVFDRDRGAAEELVVHRVTSVHGDGTLRTTGDANATEDAAPVGLDQVRGTGVLLVPAIGLPAYWWQSGAWPMLAAWAAATTLLLRLAIDRVGPRRPRRFLGTRLQRAELTVPTAGGTAALCILLIGVSATQSAGGVEAAFTATTRAERSSWQVAYPYLLAVMADKPALYYALDEPAGSTVAKDTAGLRLNGTYRSVARFQEPGFSTSNPDGRPRNPGTSIQLDGKGGRIVSGGPATRIPSTFSIEIWFPTSSTRGGKVVGFESTRDDAASAKYDRHVFMRPDGRLVYGAWRVVDEPTILLTSALSYNDSKWHHLVLTGYVEGGLHRADMFLDGALVTSGLVTTPSDYYGWWRAGYGGLPTGDGYPESADFHAHFDNVAGYSTRLSAARVKAHFDAR